jgi:hypothetical protein
MRSTSRARRQNNWFGTFVHALWPACRRARRRSQRQRNRPRCRIRPKRANADRAKSWSSAKFPTSAVANAARPPSPSICSTADANASPVRATRNTAAPPAAAALAVARPMPELAPVTTITCWAMGLSFSVTMCPRRSQAHRQMKAIAARVIVRTTRPQNHRASALRPPALYICISRFRFEPVEHAPSPLA